VECAGLVFIGQPDFTEPHTAKIPLRFQPALLCEQTYALRVEDIGKLRKALSQLLLGPAHYHRDLLPPRKDTRQDSLIYSSPVLFAQSRKGCCLLTAERRIREGNFSGHSVLRKLTFGLTGAAQLGSGKQTDRYRRVQ
jgi:hypothetical protein